MNRESVRTRAAIVILAILYWLVPWSRLTGIAAPVGVPLVLVLAVLAPGAAIVRRARLWSGDLLGDIARAGAAGLFFILAYCFLWALSGVDAAVARQLLPVAAIALVWISPPADRTRAPLDPSRSRTSERWLRVAVVTVIVSVAAAAYVTGPMLDFDKDSIDHAGYVEEIARTGDPFPVSAVYAEAASDGTDLRKNLLHAAYGLFVSQLHLEPVALFRVVGAIFTVVVASMVYAAALSLFASRIVALLSVLLFFVSYQGGMTGDLFRSFYYPNRFGIGVLLLFIAAATRASGAGSRRTLLAVAVLAFTATAIHIQYAVLVGLVCGILCIMWRVHGMAAVRAGAAAAAGVLPVAVFRFVTAYERNALHDQVQGAMYITDKWFVADPISVWHWLGLIGVAAIVAAFALRRDGRRVAGAGYTCGALLVVLLISFVPFLYTPIYARITYLVQRLDMVVPFYMLAAYMVTRTRTLRSALPATLIVVAVVAACWHVADGTSVFSPRAVREARARSFSGWSDDLMKISDGISGRAVVASDPLTSYMLSGFTPHFVVCTLDQHAPPSDIHSVERMRVARDIMSPLSSSAARVQAMKKAGAEYILVNQALPPRMILNYWSFPPDVAATTARAIDGTPDLFEYVAGYGALSLYRWTGREAAEGQVLQNPLIAEVVPPDAVAIDAVSGAARLVAARAHVDYAVPGDTVDVDMYWSRERAMPPANYVVVVRMDCVDVALPLDGKPFPKIARKLKERRDGRRFRFRADHMLSDGFFGPDAWPDGAIVRDRARVVIPADAAPGTYQASAIVVEKANVPNYRLRDFLYDDDLFAGVVFSQITISTSSP